MREIGFDTQILNNEGAQIREEIAIAREMINKTYLAMSELDATWEGAAKSAFQTAFQKDRELMTDLCATLEGIADSMQESRNDYEKCDEEVLDLIRTLE